MENDLKTADSDSEFDAAFKAGIAAPKKTTASTATPVAAGAVASSPTEDNAENEFNAAFYSSNPQAAPSSQSKKTEQYGPSKDNWERDQLHNRYFKEVLEETKGVSWENLSQAQQQFFVSQYEPRYIGMIPSGYPLTQSQQKAYENSFIQAVSGKRHQDLTQSEEKLLGSFTDPKLIKQIPKHFILTEEQKRILHDHKKAESYLTWDNAESVFSGFAGMIKDSVEALWKGITELPAPASPEDALMLKATAGGDAFEAFQNKQAEKSRKNVADITSPAAQLPEDLSEFGNRIAEGGMRPADWLEEKLGWITPEQAFQRFSLRKDVETAFEAQRHEMPSAWARAISDQQALSDPIMSAFGAALDPRPWSGADGVGLVERYKTSSAIVDGMRQSGALEEYLKSFGPEDPRMKTLGMFILPEGSGMGVFGAAGAGLKIGSAGYSALRSGTGNFLRGAESARIVANGLERARMNRIDSAVKGLEEEVKRFDGLAADAAKEGKTLSSLDMPVPQGPTNLNVARAVSNASGKAPSIEGWRPLDRNALQQSLMQKGKSAEEAFNLARQEALKEAQAIGGMGLFGANAGEALAINTAKETAEKLRFEMKLEGRSKVGSIGRFAGKTEGKMEEVVKGLDDLASKTPEVVKAFAPYLAGGAVGLLSSDEHPVLGALGGAGGGKLLTKTPKLIGKSAGLVRALSEARAISAGGSVGTFETLGRTGLPAGGEKAALGLSQSGRLADKTLDFFTDVLIDGANAGLLATAIGMGESADAEQMMNLVGQGWLFAAKHGIQAKGIRAIKSLASQEPQFTAREAAQRRVDDAKAYRDMTPESKKAFDYASSWDAQVERQEELLKAAQLDHWRESNKDPNSKETKDAAVKIEFQEKQLDQFKRADIPTRSLYGRSLARQLGELQKLLNGTLREGQNNVGIHILTRDQIVSHFLNGRDPSRVSPEEVQEILIKANQKGIYSNPANGSAGAFDPAKPSMVLNADSIRARIVYLGESASQAMWHEAGHHLMHVPEFIDAIAPQMDALFGKTITQADGTVLEETPGSLSNKDLVERYLDSKTGYMKKKTPERMKMISQVLGLWDHQNDVLDDPSVAEYMKGEIAADLVAEGMSNSLGGNLDSKVKHAMDLARVKAKMGLLDKMRARLGFLFDAAALSDSPEAISKETGVAFTPEMMAATRIALRRIRDLNGEFSGTGEESEGPKVTRAQMMASKAQRDRYGKESGMFKTELVAQIVDAAGKPVGEPVVISSPGAMEGFWQNTFNVTLPAEKLSKTNGFGELPAQLRLSPVSGNGGIKITSRIATEADGVTPITLSPRESRELLKSRGVVIREAFNTPDEGTPGRFEPVSEGSQTYRGTFTPAQIQAIRNLPESIIPASIKAKMLKINEIVSRKDGTRIVIDYAAMMNDKGKYVAYSPKIYDLVPIGMHLSKDGNFLATTISYGRLLSKLNAWAERKPGILSPWNGNKELFMQVFINKYLRNWQYREQGPDGVEMYPNGRPGEYGLDRDPEMAKAKKDIFNDFLNLTNALTPADAPRTTTPRRVGDPRGKDIDRTIMSTRMDHIAELIENESAPKVPINYRNAVMHFAPEDAESLDQSPRQNAPRMREDARRGGFRFSLEQGAQDAQNGVESPLAKAYLDLSNTRELFKFGLVSQKTRDKAGKVIEGLPQTIRDHGDPGGALTVGKAEQAEYATKAKKLFEVIAKDVMPGVKVKTSTSIDKYGDELAIDVGDSTIYIVDFTSTTPHINSTEVGRGNNGAALYQVVNDWANAFGKTIIGDPGGITPINIIRRTGNMISSALRSGGDTSAWEPEAKRQGVDWVVGDHVGNLTNLLAREAELSRNIAPELQYLKYDLNTGAVAFNGFPMSVKSKLLTAIEPKLNQQLDDLNASISFYTRNQSGLSEVSKKKLDADIKKKEMLQSLDLNTPEGFLNAIAALNYGDGLGAATARRAVITQSLGDFSPAKRQPTHQFTEIYEDFTPRKGPLDVGKVASSLAKQKFSLFASPEEAIDEVKLSIEQGAKDVQKGVESPLAKAYLDLSNTKELFKFGLVSQETSNKVEEIVRELPLSIRTPGNNYRAGKLTVSEPEQNEYAAKAAEALKLIVEDVMPGAGASVDYEINQYGDRLNISVGNAVLSIENFTARKPHINSVSVGRGNNGAGMYQAVNDWAISLGKTIIGDLGGITDVNIIRRTGNMISSVLRAGGDTNTWEPELRQQGVSWTAGDDVGNLTNLLVREAELARRIAPELQYLTYDLRTGNLDFSGNAIRSRNNIAVSIAPKLKAKIKQLEEDIEYYKSDPLPITPRIAERIKSDLQQIEVMKSMPLNTPESFLDAIAAIHYREGVGSATARRTVITQSLGEFSKTNRSPLSLDNVYEDFTSNKGPVDVSNVASSLAKQKFSLFASPEETRDEVEKIERAVYRNPRTWEVTEGGTHLNANPAGPQEPTDRETPNYAFRTTAGRVVSRKEALEIAKKAGQILDSLTPEQQDYLDRGVLHSGMYQPSEAKGVNVNSKTQPYADMIVSGDKTIETRDTRSLDSTIGKRVGIIRTGGKGKGSLIGSAVVGEPIEYRSEEEFRADESRHKVPKDDKYDIKEGGVKYGYSMSDVRPLEPSEISGGGRVISNLAGTRFSLEEENVPDFVKGTLKKEGARVSAVIGGKPGKYGWTYEAVVKGTKDLEKMSKEKADLVQGLGEKMGKVNGNQELVLGAGRLAAERDSLDATKDAARISEIDDKLKDFETASNVSGLGLTVKDAVQITKVADITKSIVERGFAMNPPPFKAPAGRPIDVSALQASVGTFLKGNPFKDFISEATGIDNIEFDNIIGTWKFDIEPSFVFRADDMSQDQANSLTRWTSFLMSQDVGIAWKPSLELQDGAPLMYLIHNEPLTREQIESALTTAKEIGIDGLSVTVDGRGIKAANFDNIQDFEAKMTQIQAAAGISEKYDTICDSYYYDTTSDFTGADGKPTMPDWLKNTYETNLQNQQEGMAGAVRESGQQATPGGLSVLLRRGIDTVLVPYAKALAGEGYTFSIDRFVERYGLNKEVGDYIREQLYPESGKDRSVSPILDGSEAFTTPDSYRTLDGKLKTSVVDLMYALQKRSADDGFILPGDYSAKASELIAQTIVDEVQGHIQRAAANPGAPNAIGWYDVALKKMKAKYAEFFPFLDKNSSSYNAAKEFIFDSVLGIASQGNNVFENGKMAARVQFLLESGKTLSEAVALLKNTFGNETVAVENNLLKLEALIRQYGIPKLDAMFRQKKTVSEWKKILKKDKGLHYNGKPLSVEGQSKQMVTGFSVFGPKIGSFINNLHGDYSTLTADLWYTRTWNRILGNVFLHAPALEASQYNSLVNALIEQRRFDDAVKLGKDADKRVAVSTTGKSKAFSYRSEPYISELTDKQFEEFINDPQRMLDFATDLEKEFRNGGYKQKSTLRRAAKSWVENRYDAVAAPRTDLERNFQQQTMELAQAELIKLGYNISIADMQAALWYNEKELFGKYGAQSTGAEPADYADAAAKVDEMLRYGALFQSERDVVDEFGKKKKQTVRLLPYDGEVKLTKVQNPKTPEQYDALLIERDKAEALVGRVEKAKEKVEETSKELKAAEESEGKFDDKQLKALRKKAESAIRSLKKLLEPSAKPAEQTEQPNP